MLPGSHCFSGYPAGRDEQIRSLVWRCRISIFFSGYFTDSFMSQLRPMRYVAGAIIEYIVIVNAVVAICLLGGLLNIC